MDKKRPHPMDVAFEVPSGFEPLYKVLQTSA